jgi:FkbM family methyltransferase
VVNWKGLLRHVQGMVRGALMGALRASARPARVAIERKPALLLERPELVLEPLLEHVAAERMLDVGEELFFVQIGAFDGQTDDPIHDLVERHRWRGVLVEPQARYFERLQQTYAGNDRVMLRNVALGSESGVQIFYRVREEPGQPEWVPQLGSFDRDTILAHEFAFPRLRDLIIEDEVETLSLEDLLAQSGAERVDVFQIDAEGFDAEVVKMIDLARWRPGIVHFEHDHLSPGDHESAMRHLADAGYKLWVKRFDTLAYRRWPAGALTESSASSTAESSVSSNFRANSLRDASIGSRS